VYVVLVFIGVAEFVTLQAWFEPALTMGNTNFNCQVVLVATDDIETFEMLLNLTVLPLLLVRVSGNSNNRPRLFS